MSGITRPVFSPVPTTSGVSVPDGAQAVALEGGGFAATWRQHNDANATDSILLQLYDAGGQAIGTAKLLANYGPPSGPRTSTTVTAVDMEALRGGGFAVVLGTDTRALPGGSSSASLLTFNHEGALLRTTSMGGGGSIDEIPPRPGDDLLALQAGGWGEFRANYTEFQPTSSYTFRFLTGDGLSGTFILDSRPTYVADMAGQQFAFYTASGGGLTQTLKGLIATAGPTTVSVQTGGTAAEALTGGSGADSLVGAGGDDVLQGGAGYDVLSGGAGADRFVLATDGSIDEVMDFTRGTDSLMLVDAQGDTAGGALSVLTWDSRTRTLSWDPDGDNGPGLNLPFATLDAVSNVGASDLAPGFRPAIIRQIGASGSRTDIQTDYANTQPWRSAAAEFSPAGAALTYSVTADDGSSWTRWFDAAGNQAWNTLVAEYDAQARLFAYSVFNDDGGRTLWLFDTTSTRAWSRVIESYDGLGRLSVQAAAMDDGTAWERHIDTYDTQPWAYYIDNYRAGSLTDHTFYRADGSVFV